MVVILLLFFTLTCVCGLPQVPLYQAEEDHNTTLRWDSPNKKDLSFINIQCFFKSTSTKFLFEMMQGVETFQDEQFSGRVHCDREALKEGRVWIHLFRLKPEDSGDYLCDMSIYDPVKRELENLFREQTKLFQLKVRSKGSVSMTTTNPEDDGNKRETPASQEAFIIVGIVVVFVLLAAILSVISLKLCRRLGNQLPQCEQNEEAAVGLVPET